METWLDEFDATFLHAAVYVDRELRVTVAEGFRAAEPEDITIGGHVIKGTYAIDTSEKSRTRRDTLLRAGRMATRRRVVHGRR